MAESKWIRVEDKLPPSIDDVLTVVEDNKGEIFQRVDWYQESLKEWFYSQPGDTVSHWMPLPELPQ